MANTCTRQPPLPTHGRRHASLPHPASLKLHVPHRWSRAGRTKSVSFAFTSVNYRRNTYPATMLGRKKNAQDREIFEMAPTLEDEGNMLATDGRAGNEEDQRHMLRLGKTPELRVSHHCHRH
jgi:hypothetical protein